MFRNNNKQVDLSRTIRLSGLSSGAKLELVQLSRSAGVVSVALQLPESEAEGVPNGRLTDKFPSSTTLWLILRKFEAGAASGGGSNRNLTARGAPAMNDGSSGAGRLFYQTPVIQVMGRELSSFTDLQKSLGQLGFNSGSALLRLSFRTSETPLEEAMTQIEDYFRSVDAPAISTEKAETSVSPATDDPLTIENGERSTQSADAPMSSPSGEPLEQSTTVNTADQAVSIPSPQSSAILPTSSSGRFLQIFAPPSSSTPSAALSSHNPDDYVPTIEHAQTHQRHLSQSTRNIRLQTDAEIAAQAAEQQEKLAAVKDVEIKIRFPDESAVSAKFGQNDTSANLYTFVKECLEERWQSEVFLLRNPGLKGKDMTVPNDEKKRLIRDLGLKGRVLVIFGWDEKNASTETHMEKGVLKAELRAQAQALKVEEIKAAEDEDEGVRINVGGRNKDEPEKEKKKGGMPKWLNKLSKK